MPQKVMFSPRHISVDLAPNIFASQACCNALLSHSTNSLSLFVRTREALFAEVTDQLAQWQAALGGRQSCRGSSSRKKEREKTDGVPEGLEEGLMRVGRRKQQTADGLAEGFQSKESPVTNQNSSVCQLKSGAWSLHDPEQN